jgi:hypothetical protein
LENKKSKTNEKDSDRVFLITTYNPNFQALREVVHKNWDMLGKSPTTSFLHEKKLMCGYRRPKNLREHLVRADIPFKEGDQLVRPIRPNEIDPEAGAPIEDQRREEQMPKPGGSRQSSILDYLTPVIDRLMPVTTLDNVLSGVAQRQEKDIEKIKLTQKKDRGFNFCNTKNCRYCPKLNKSGKIRSTITGKTYNCMKNVSCRSSNLIYCITCKTCNKQYVGQTLLRLKGRFVHHFYTVNKPDKSKPVGKHFSQLDHHDIDDMEIHVLEFVSKPPRSQAAEQIRDRVEKRWIHLLRTPAPGGLNIED